MKKISLNIVTTLVTEDNLNNIIDSNYLPIFVIRDIHKSKIIGKYTNTFIHFKDLAPSSMLYQSWRDNIISQEEYDRLYLIELSEVDIFKFIQDLETLATCSNANGVCLMGYGDYSVSNRKILSDLINEFDILDTPIYEKTFRD